MEYLRYCQTCFCPRTARCPCRERGCRHLRILRTRPHGCPPSPDARGRIDPAVGGLRREFHFHQHVHPREQPGRFAESLRRALEQFLSEVYFGDLDVLFLDLPPGTGDVAISVAQLLSSVEILLVTTPTIPQPTAAKVAERREVSPPKPGRGWPEW